MEIPYTTENKASVNRWSIAKGANPPENQRWKFKWWILKGIRDRAPKPTETLRNEVGLKHHSLQTEQTCVDWIKRFILFYGKRDPLN
ncbi:MAG: hypothetical protein WKH97_20380 [Casimicrobiaceae bacterium]